MTDGTAAGTVALPASAIGSGDQPGLNQFTAAGNLVYFDDGVNHQLWRTDGTDAGTLLVSDIANSSTPSRITLVGSEIYFFASGNNSSLQNLLYKTDGTPEGTLLVKDFGQVFAFDSNGGHSKRNYK